MATSNKFFKLVHVSDVLVRILFFNVFEGAFPWTRGSNRHSVGLLSSRLLFLHRGLSLRLLLLLHLLFFVVIFIVWISFFILVLLLGLDLNIVFLFVRFGWVLFCTLICAHILLVSYRRTFHVLILYY